MDDKSFHIRIPKAWARTALVVASTALVVAPLTAVAGHSFNDVPDTNIFHSDIEWLRDADVSRGCNPPANTLFCPTDNVTRQQMAAFMKRLAENQVVDAATLEGFSPGDFTLALQPTALDSGVEDLILTTPSSSACFPQKLGVPAGALTAHY